MKTTRQHSPGKPGFVSYALVLATGMILTMLMVYSYRRAVASQGFQSTVQLRTDYAQKEAAILRAIVSLTPNRAIQAMQNGSNNSSTTRNPLRWQNIFSDALGTANARTSVPAEILATLNLGTTIVANTGDSALGTPSKVFSGVTGESGAYVSAGINRSLGTSYPVPLSTANSTTINNDPVYPIISNDKQYSTLAQSGVGLPVGSYPNFNLLTYPQIRFGYANPGDPFVAKRNWWAFSMDLAEHDATQTRIAKTRRNFVLSIYEIPSQLAISAASFMALGNLSSGEAWGDVNIQGNVFAGKASVEGAAALESIASRRGMSISSDALIGGRNFTTNPFTPGLLESYQITESSQYPVSLASESGRVAFIPINRGADYFDRFSHSSESNTLSPTTWNQYSVGALQCAMRLDITDCVSSVNPLPTRLRFSYLKSGERKTLSIPLLTGPVSGLPAGYLFACNENQTYNFGTATVDLAYGKNGVFAFQSAATGSVTFNNARFGDPLVGTVKAGYFRPSYPFEIRTLGSGKICVAVYPKRFPAFLAAINADSTTTNHSLVVNVDYTSATGSVNLRKPNIPCTASDYGVILQECRDMTDFPRGFSLVSNLRTYFGEDFNIIPGTPPSGYTPMDTYYPPCSFFVPEKRYGVDMEPYGVNISGQIGSVASETNSTPVRPIDSITVGGTNLPANRIRVNLKPIRHPAELPPISMMNWLVVLEERRSEFVSQ